MEDAKPKDGHPNAELLQSATKGFDYLFSNDIVSARELFKQRDDPFHMMGLGVCGFLEAALGMESGLMTEASRCLALSEAGTRKQMRTMKPHDLSHHSRFHYGLEWEILNADAVVLLGLTHALSESYMGYLQCMYSLNSAHSKFTKLYKTVFPNGLPSTPNFKPASATVHLSPNRLPVSPSLPASLHNSPSTQSLASLSSVGSAATIHVPPPAPAVKATGFFSRWVGASSVPSLPLQTMQSATYSDGPVEDLIIAGTAFGFGLFNLVFSLLPKKVQGLVGFFGFKHDRKLALKALSLSATKEDVHGVFAGLVLMTYYGVVLLLSGYQANEDALLAEYRTIVDKIENRYPQGALWILNRAKIMRMGNDADGAILVLRDGLKPNRKHSFAQADMLLIFELAWTLLSQRRYQEAADTFLKITELNSWSHGTYYFIAAGCYFCLGNYEKAQQMLDAIPDLINKRRMSGKDLPTEVFIKKKLAFWRAKQIWRGGDETKYVEAIKISPAEEIGIFWNNHARISTSIAQAHIDVLKALTPPVHTNRISLDSATPSASSLKSAKSPRSVRSRRVSGALSTSPPTPQPEDQGRPLDLDNPDELAIRALLLGVNYRTMKEYEIARGFLNEAYEYHSLIKTSTWVGGVAMFELAVLDLKEVEEADQVRAAAASPALSSHGPSPLKVSITVDTELANGDAEPDRLQTTRPYSMEERKSIWVEALKSASHKLDTALGLATNAVDLSSRLDSRIAMLRDEIATKKDLLGV